MLEKMSQWAKHASRFGRDGYQLARAIVQNRSSDIKPVLLDHARNANTVANSWLQVEKQVGLVKYYGISEYIKQRLQSTTTTTSGAVTTSDAEESTTIASNSISSTRSGAKVAFMVTASMKQELKERLEYDADQIKSMTPLEASLILNHSIVPADKDERLPVLTEEYEIQQQKQAEEEMLRVQIEQEEEANKLRKAAAATETKPHPFPSGPSSSTQDFLESGGFSSVNLVDQPTEVTGWGETCFEVTETKDGETSRVALYMNEEEAKLGLKTRQEIANDKGLSYTYELHQISKDNL